MKKIVFFVENGLPTPDDLTLKSLLTKEGNKVTFSNGSIPYGFEDSCNKVVMSKPFSHVVAWCERIGLDYDIGESAVDIEDAEFVDEDEDVEVDEEQELRDEYFALFGKKAGNMKLENIKAAIAEATKVE